VTIISARIWIDGCAFYMSLATGAAMRNRRAGGIAAQSIEIIGTFVTAGDGKYSAQIIFLDVWVMRARLRRSE
jgi:hypothetical protein